MSSWLPLVALTQQGQKGSTSLRAHLVPLTSAAPVRFKINNQESVNEHNNKHIVYRHFLAGASILSLRDMCTILIHVNM